MSGNALQITGNKSRGAALQVSLFLSAVANLSLHQEQVPDVKSEKQSPALAITKQLFIAIQAIIAASETAATFFFEKHRRRLSIKQSVLFTGKCINK